MKCYSLGGQQVPDGPKAYAKEENQRFFIKYVRSGQDAGHFINPFSMWFVDEINSAKLSNKGTNALEYKEVNSSVFSLYIKFLETQNAAYFRQAERSVI